MDLPSSPCGAGVAAIGKEIWLSRILEHYCRECIVEDDSACTGPRITFIGFGKIMCTYDWIYGGIPCECGKALMSIWLQGSRTTIVGLGS